MLIYRNFRSLTVVLAIFASAASSALGMSVSLGPSVQSPAPVGTVIRWTAQTPDAAPARSWYRFRVREAGNPFETIVDYGPKNTFDWTAGDHEGTYEIEASARNLDTGDTAVTSALYQMTSRVTGDSPVISPTANPLVFLYSTPACPAGSRMRVQFTDAGGNPQSTPSKACHAGRSMNFYLAGFRQNETYSVQHTIDSSPQPVNGPILSLTSGVLPKEVAAYTVLMSHTPAVTGGVVLQSTILQMSLATDLNGNVIWFYDGDISFLTRPEPGGKFFGIFEEPTTDTAHQFFREIDVAGNTLLETNAARVSEQLIAVGAHPITAFHHEARRTPDGKILLLATTERFLTDIQGPGAVDVLGDTIIVLDKDLQLAWYWDAFDHLDPRRMATLGEVCAPVGGGCPPFYQAPQANDWLHGNSLQVAPDGAILYSVRHQDWVVKIDYGNGTGSGDVIWRLGKDGEFRMVSDDPNPWFSHQHDAQFERDGMTMTLFDDGNVRRASDPTANSRGQVLQIDESNRTARLSVNTDLGAYSYALGAAQRLPNGHFFFGNGWIRGGPDGSENLAQSIELDSNGNIVYNLQVATPLYRSFRMRDLYTPYQ